MKTLIICHINRHLVAKYKQSHFTSYIFTKKYTIIYFRYVKLNQTEELEITKQRLRRV